MLYGQQARRDALDNVDFRTLAHTAIDRQSPVPFYFQLTESLEREIESGRLSPGQQLPSEPALCEHYGVSRTTVRQALARLEQQGLITRDKGRGTFVSQSRPRSWLIQATEGFFHHEFARTGNRVTSRILRLERGTLPAWASDALSLPLGSEGMIVERVRAVDGLVALYVTNCLPLSVAEAVEHLGPNDSLYQQLETKGGVTVVGGRRTVEAVIAGDRLAALLEVAPSDALAHIESVSWDSATRPVDCYQAWLRTDRMRIDLGVSAPNHGGALLPDLLAADPQR